jgi:hypothetical protein
MAALPIGDRTQKIEISIPAGAVGALLVASVNPATAALSLATILSVIFGNQIAYHTDA